MFIFVVKIMPFAIITLRNVYATDYNDFGNSSMSILSVRLQNRRECNGIYMFSFCRFLYWALLRFLGGATMFLWFSQKHQQNKTFAALRFLNFIIFYSEMGVRNMVLHVIYCMASRHCMVLFHRTLQVPGLSKQITLWLHPRNIWISRTQGNALFYSEATLLVSMYFFYSLS